MKTDRTMQERMNSVIQSTWQYIGSDAHELGVRTVAEAAELVLDADRCLSNGGDKEAAEALYKMEYKDMFKFAKKCLKHYF